MATLCLFAIPVVLALGLRGGKLSLLQMRVLRALSGYYAVAYVGRGVYLLLVNPQPSPGTFIADDRLLQPGYWEGLNQIAPLALLGVVVLLLAFYLAARLLTPRLLRSHVPVPSRASAWARGAVLSIGVGWIFRLYAIGVHAVPPPGLIGRLTVLPTAALGVLVIGLDWRALRGVRLLVIAAAVGEAVWGVGLASKTPVLAVGLFMYLDPGRRRIGIAMPAFAALSALVAFAVIQPGKTTLAVSDYNGSPILTLPAEILTRLDLLHATTIAFHTGPGSYLSQSQFLAQLADGWTPSTLSGEVKLNAGQLWGILEQGSVTGTHVAEGPTAEGYVMAGYLGVVTEAAVVGLLVALSVGLLASRPGFSLTLLGAAVLSTSAVFERGMLGMNEAISTAAQLAVIGAVLYLAALASCSPHLSKDRTRDRMVSGIQGRRRRGGLGSGSPGADL